MRFALLLTILLCGCGDDSQADPCERPGSTEACACDGPSEGYRLCLDDGSLSECVCDADRTIPCSAPGASFACRCGDGMLGSEVCLEGGSYSDCDCTAAAPVDAGSAPPMDEPAAGCPAPYLCTSQMGANVCTDEGGFPPLCETATDCITAGMPDAQCVDPAALGVTLCLQSCQL